MTMLASLIVPVRNAGRYLPRTVPSWLDQELDAPFEVLLVDNGSTDGGFESLPDHPRLRRLHEPRPGPYAARNTGAGAARGELLVFVDPDCLAPPGWLDRLLRPLRRNDRPAAAQGPAQTGGRAAGLRLISLYELHREAFVYGSTDPRLYYAHTNNRAVRRSAFEACGPFQLRVRGADTMFARQIVETFGCAALVHAADAPLLHLEIDRLSVWLRKTYLYGRHRLAASDDVRSLRAAERLAVWRNARRAARLSPLEAGGMLAMLALGLGCWWAGCAAGNVQRRIRPLRASTTGASSASSV